MKKSLAMICLLALLTSCSWFHHGDSNSAEQSGGAFGNEYSPGRGTTGVSSGADIGAGITGSDAAPPR